MRLTKEEILVSNSLKNGRFTLCFSSAFAGKPFLVDANKLTSNAEISVRSLHGTNDVQGAKIRYCLTEISERHFIIFNTYKISNDYPSDSDFAVSSVKLDHSGQCDESGYLVPGKYFICAQVIDKFTRTKGFIQHQCDDEIEINISGDSEVAETVVFYDDNY